MREFLRNKLEQGYTSTTFYGEVLINSTPISQLLNSQTVIEDILADISYPVYDGYQAFIGYDYIVHSTSLDMEDEEILDDLRTLGISENDIQEAINNPESDVEMETFIDYDILLTEEAKEVY